MPDKPTAGRRQGGTAAVARVLCKPPPGASAGVGHDAVGRGVAERVRSTRNVRSIRLIMTFSLHIGRFCGRDLP